MKKQTYPTLSAEELSEKDKKHFIHPTTVPETFIKEGPKIIFSKGKGAKVEDAKGNIYIDGISMLWNVNLGHGQTELAEAAYEQMNKLAFGSSFYGYSNEVAIHLTDKLAEMAPGDLNAVFLTSGGSEANDSAFKLARFYWDLNGKPKKKKIISIKNGYHGVTVSAGTATSLAAFHKFSGSYDPDILTAKSHLTNCERGDSTDPNYEGCIRDIIEKEGADNVAGVIMETIQGSGGVHIPPEGYLQAVKDLCEEKNVLFIADEVICGFGRTGEMFGVDHWDIKPDMLCFAKGVTSGYMQLGGVLVTQEIRDVLMEYDDILAHGFTYSGHPVACAVGLKNLEIIERENIVGNVKKMEQELLKGFRYLENKHPHFAKPRTKGLLAGFELQANREGDQNFDPSFRADAEVVEECYKRNLILRPIGNPEIGENIVAVSPPLTVNKSEIEEIINILDAALDAFEKKL